MKQGNTQVKVARDNEINKSSLTGSIPDKTKTLLASFTSRKALNVINEIFQQLGLSST